MNISVLQPRVSYYVGGSEKVALKHIELLSNIDGNQIVLYTVKPPDNIYSPFFKQITKTKIKIEEVVIPEKYKFIYSEQPEINQSRWDRESLLFSILTQDFIKKQSPNIIMSYYIVDAIFRHLNIPNVVYLGGHPKNEIEIYNAFLSFYDATICNSNNVYNMWKDKIRNNKVPLNFILPKGSSMPSDYKKIFGNPLNIVFAGRLIMGKGVDILISSMADVLKYYPDVILWILGDGPERDHLEKISTSLNLNRNIKFLGFIENVQDYFHGATMCVFPSVPTVFKEGLMTVVAEAMSAGACVVSSIGVGNEELIENGKNGILIEPDNKKKLAEVIIELIEDQDKREQLSKEAIKFAKRNLSWEKIGLKLNSILAEVINHNSI